MNNRISSIPGVLTVEVDLNTVTEGQTPPPPLEREIAEKLGWSLAEDLQRMLGKLDQYGLVILAGLYDMTELLRPGLPMADILTEIYLRSLPDTRFQPQLMTIGAHGETFPIPGIAPRRTPGSGPLFLIPFLFIGNPAELDALGSNMEKTLLEKGQASAKTGQIIQKEFGITPLNLSYATFNDLCALLKIQLDNNGFGDLWALLHAALFPGNEPVRRQLPQGNLFLLHHGVVYTRYPGFSEWAEHFADGSDTDLLLQYSQWQRLQRQYTAGLGAHGLEVRTVAGIPETEAIERLAPADAFGLAQQHALPATADRVQEVLVDTGHLDGLHRIALLEHRLPELGPVAFTVTAFTADDTLLFKANEYPLTPQAVRTIPEGWRTLAAEHGVILEEAQPGTLLFSGNPPQLAAFPEA